MKNREDKYVTKWQWTAGGRPCNKWNASALRLKEAYAGWLRADWEDVAIIDTSPEEVRKEGGYRVVYYGHGYRPRTHDIEPVVQTFPTLAQAKAICMSMWAGDICTKEREANEAEAKEMEAEVRLKRAIQYMTDLAYDAESGFKPAPFAEQWEVIAQKLASIKED